MKCAWNQLLGILPSWLRKEVDAFQSKQPQEIRLRINAPPEVVCNQSIFWLSRNIEKQDIAFCINTASQYSPWAAATTAQGYLTAPGGHRIGLCGDAVIKEGRVSGIRSIQSICIRVARDFPGIASKLPQKGSVLILGAPGWGKTTLLRDLIRCRAEREAVAVVDERGELFPTDFSPGKRTDILTGVPKKEGIEMLLRTMGPQCIAVDEITAPEDGLALIQAAGCGVELLATAHAGSLEDYFKRPAYQSLIKMRIFDSIIVLCSDKTYRTERIGK